VIPAIDETHDPSRTSWVESANRHADFPVQSLPFGIFSLPNDEPRPGVAIGDRILCLKSAAERGLIPAASTGTDSIWTGATLNMLFALPAAERRTLRRRLSMLLSDAAYRDAVRPLLHAADACTLHLPAAIGDYADFYVGIHHANNVGRQFRPDNPLLPNYKWVPIGYHGRASSVRPSGVPVVRPRGQCKGPNDDAPEHRPSRRLDYELELGVWIGPGNALGEPIPIDEAYDHIAGLCLLNDWSARDLQAWEYQPLGPFLAKNFHSTVSPWVVTAEALAPFRIAQPPRPTGDPQPLPYLWSDRDQASGALAIDLTVSISTAAMRQRGIAPHPLSRGPARNMYWTIAQIVTHHASGGCNLQPGDLLGTGTISGPEPGSYGSLLELTVGGSAPVTLPTGETRTFLDDGDEVLLSATARAEGFVPIGFGGCRAIVLPAMAARSGPA
jgi:fumarylacetoacetase